MKNILLALIYVLFVSLSSNILAKDNFKIVNLQVSGMTSPTCPVLLKSAVNKIRGVKSIKASLENNSATIEFDETQTSLEKIQDTIELHVGFSTELRRQ